MDPTNGIECTQLDTLDKGDDWYEFAIDELIPKWDGKSLVLEFSHENLYPGSTINGNYGGLFQSGGVYKYYSGNNRKFTAMKRHKAIHSGCAWTTLEVTENCGGFPFCGCNHNCAKTDGGPGTCLRQDEGNLSWFDHSCRGTSEVCGATVSNVGTEYQMQTPLQLVLQGELIISRSDALCTTAVANSLIFDFKDKFFDRFTGAESITFRHGLFKVPESVTVYNATRTDINAPNALVARGVDVSQALASVLEFSIHGLRT